MIPLSEHNSWVPGPDSPGQSPQSASFDAWIWQCVDEILHDDFEFDDSRQLDVSQVLELVNRLNGHHPGVNATVRVGADDPELAGAFRRATKEIILPSALDDARWATSLGATSVKSEHLERYRPTLVMSLYADALVNATYEQDSEVPQVELGGPECVGTFIYVLDRYVEHGTSLELAGFLEESALDIGLRIRRFLPEEWTGIVEA